MCGGQSAVRTTSLLQDSSNAAAFDSKDCGRQQGLRQAAQQQSFDYKDSLQASPFSVSAFGGQQLAAVCSFSFLTRVQQHLVVSAVCRTAYSQL
jgi:hypothetical protein